MDDRPDLQPDSAFFNVLGIVFALSVSIAAAMMMVLASKPIERAAVTQVQERVAAFTAGGINGH